MRVIQVEKYGKTVWCNGIMDSKRKQECLCLNCALIDNCKEAQHLFDFSVKHCMAMMITRCPNWERK